MAYWDERTSLDPLAAVIDATGSRQKNSLINALQLRPLKKVIRRGDRVLDLGCGSGRALGQFTAQGARVAGVDISPKMIEVAQRSNPDAELCVYDGNTLPFLEASFDVVFTMLMLQGYAEEPGRFQALCSEARRVLDARGRLLMVERVTPGGTWALDAWRARLGASGFELVDAVVVRHAHPSLAGRLALRLGLPPLRPVVAAEEAAARRRGISSPYVECLMTALPA